MKAPSLVAPSAGVGALEAVETSLLATLSVDLEIPCVVAASLLVVPSVVVGALGLVGASLLVRRFLVV